MKILLVPMALALASGAPAATLDSQPLAAEQAPQSLPVRVVGRAASEPGGSGHKRQWPGTYFEAAMRGETAYFSVGTGDVILHVLVDGTPAGILVKPRPGLYRIRDMGEGTHRLRVQVVSESQSGPTVFGGFFAPAGTQAMPVAGPHRQIEFIGDSFTVGYGNRSTERTCSPDKVWETTDTAHGIAALTAEAFGADYQVNAVSGRGMVRNYGGSISETLPELYPFVTFAKAQLYADPAWQPRVIVIGLGTNDFSTPLRAGEKWPTRDALRADFEESFLRFVKTLRARHPHAHFLLWAAEPREGEIMREVARVAARLEEQGETRIGYVPVSGLDFSSCDYHPSLADDARVAGALVRAIEAQPGIWDSHP